MLKHAFTIHLFLHRYTLCNNLFFPSFHTGSYSGIKMFWQPHANKIKYVAVYMGYKAVVIYTSLCHICSLKGSCILNIGGPPIWMWGSIAMQTRDYHFVDLSGFFPMQKIFLNVWNEKLGSWYQMTCSMAKLPLHPWLPSSQATFSIRMFPSGSSSSLRIRADHLVFLLLIKAAWESPQSAEGSEAGWVPAELSGKRKIHGHYSHSSPCFPVAEVPSPHL